jgi:hypothetical protein
MNKQKAAASPDGIAIDNMAIKGNATEKRREKASASHQYSERDDLPPNVAY